MKTLKYGIALCIGLCMTMASVLAQSAGQSGEITLRPNGLRNDVDSNGRSMPAEAVMSGGERERTLKFDRDMHFPEEVRVALDKSDYNDAVNKMEAFVKKVKDNPCEVALMRCNFYNQLSWNDPKYRENVKEAMAYAETQCTKKSALYMWKVKIFGQEKPDSVIVWLDKAIEVEPYPDIYTMRGDKLYAIGEAKKACEDYKKAKEEDSEAASKYQWYCAGYEVNTNKEENAPAK